MKFPVLSFLTSVFSLLALSSLVFSQNLNFEQINMVPLPPLSQQCVESADLNGDGLEDIVISGRWANNSFEPNITIFFNQPDDTFEKVELSFPLTEPSFEIFDADNDGDLDLFVTGRNDSDPFARLFINDGQGNMQVSNAANVVPIFSGNVDSGDVDGDGDLDLVLGGDASSSFRARIYFNDGDGGFNTSNSTSLNPNFFVTDIRLFDIDSDEDLDVLIVHQYLSQGGNQFKVLINNGLGEFSEQEIEIGFDFYPSTNLGIADFDGNGFLDLIGNRKIHFNEGDYNFTASDFEVSLFPNQDYFEDPNVKRFYPYDIDIDGDMDLIVTGTAEQMGDHFEYEFGFTRVFENLGSGELEMLDSSSIRGFSRASLVFGNFVGDDLVDFFIIGSNHYGVPDREIYERKGSMNFEQFNRFPFPYIRDPRTIVEDFNGDNRDDYLIMGWSGFSSARENFSMYLNSADGKYYLNENQPYSFNSHFVDVVALDVENDGDIDLYVKNEPNNQIQKSNIIYKNDGLGNFTAHQFLDDTLALTSETFGQAGDLNGDGFEDIVVPYILFTELLINDGQGNFSLLEAPGLPDLSVWYDEITFSLFDYNDDGFLDVIRMPGDPDLPNSDYANIYLNDGQSSFSLMDEPHILKGLDEGIPPVRYADFDNDGDLDIFLSGAGSTFNFGGNALYENLGGGEYFEYSLEESLNDWVYLNGFIRLKDMNADNYVDIIMTQTDETQIYLNNGDFSFDLFSSENFQFPDHAFTAIDALDSDNDGDMDLVIAGSRGAEPDLYPQETLVFENTLFVNSLNTAFKKVDKKSTILFPNPTTNRVSIKGKSDWVEVYDLKGKLIMSEYGNEVINRELDVSSEKPGLYLIRTNRGTEKLIIQ